MKTTIKILLILSAVLSSGARELKAQEKGLELEKFKRTKADSLFGEFSSTIYFCYYTPKYMPTSKPTFTVLRVDIDKKGKVINIQFSDSADSSFVKAYTTRKKWHDDKATLEKYAAEKSFTDISLLIPVSWEPQYSGIKEGLSYEELKKVTKFDNKDFTGPAIVFRPIYIKLSTTGNM